ncbi:MAG: hypothetical protein Q8P61_03950 [Candidatus Nanopelagicales bacterium]|nr:hypothetical protein [Candidatus Nanopelagicales bacterium]
MQSEPEVFPFDYGIVFAAVGETLPAVGFRVVSADPATGVIHGTTELSPASWGENLTIQLGSAQPAETTVVIHSNLKFGLVDWGKNKRNVAKIQEELRRRLGVNR